MPKFKVTNPDGSKPDFNKIGLETWTYSIGLYKSGYFAITDDGSLLILDYLDRAVYCPRDRFRVTVEDEPVQGEEK